MKNLLNQLLKFSIVGGSAFVIDYGILIAMTEIFNINYLVSSGFSFIVSVVYNYVLSIKWVFYVGENRNKKHELFCFFILSLIGLGINQILMWLLVDGLDVFYMFSKIIVTVVVMFYNFITRKIFLEKK